MTADPPSRQVRAAWEALDLDFQRLWIDYAALGGELSPDDLAEWLTADRPIEATDVDRVVHAVNERLVDLGRTPLLPYSGD